MSRHRITTLQPVLLLTITFSALCLTACAGSQPATPFNDEFSTEITPNNTKFFTYVRHLPKGTEPDKGMRKAIQGKLDTTGYCRDGYLTLEHYHANGIVRIRGECRDGASDSDRKQFPNR